MIFVQPAYLPSVNYFKDFNDNDLVYNINLGLDESDYFDETYMSNENGVFKVKVPTTNKNKSKFQRDIQIDYNNNWIKSHTHSLQSAYGKFPYFIFYLDPILNVLKTNHKFMIDLNYDLLSLFLELLNYDQKPVKNTSDNIINNKKTILKSNNSLMSVDNIVKMRDDFLLGKNFDYSLSVVDLLFLKGPETGYYIRNF